MSTTRLDRRSVLKGGGGTLVAGALALPAAAADAQQEGLPDLARGLKETQGCLGVELAKTQSGKNCIFAWFEDKKALLRWYYSPMHMQAMRTFFPNEKPNPKPLAEIPDNSGPIMAIASITFTDKPKVEGTSLPISQIAIELYAPLKGGLHFGGTFAPEKLKAPGVKPVSPGK